MNAAQIIVLLSLSSLLLSCAWYVFYGDVNQEGGE